MISQEIYSQYLSYGLSVIGCNEKKEAVTSWEGFKSVKAKQSDIDRFQRAGAVSIAIVCGEVSQNLLCIDFDLKYHPTGIDLFESCLDKIIDYLGGGENLVIVSTPSGGRHLWFRSDNVSTNKKLAGRPTTEEERKKNPKLKRLNFIETRGQGGYAVAPPSAGYEFLQGSFAFIPHLKSEQMDDVLAICKSYNVIEEDKIEQRPKNVPVHIYKNAPWDAYNNDTSDPHLKVLEESGWEFVAKIGDRIYYKRPGSENKWSANWHTGKRLFYVFTSNSEFEPDNAYTPFTIYMKLAHDGNKKEAIKALRKAGYGEAWTENDHKVIKSVAVELEKGKMFEDIIAHLLYDSPQITEQEQKKIFEAAVSINKVKRGAFWRRGSKGALSIDRVSFLSFLQSASPELQKLWRVVLLVDDPKSLAYRMTIVNEETRIIYQTHLKGIKVELFNWVSNFDFSEYDVSPDEISNLVIGITDAAWENILDYIPVTPISEFEFLRDTKDTSYHFFLNNIVKVTADDILYTRYEDLDGDKYVWREKIIPRNFNNIAIQGEEFILNSYLSRFLQRLSGFTPDNEHWLLSEPKTEEEIQRFEALYAFMTAYGYLITNFKDPDKPYTILIAEDTEDDGQGGGTGKGLFMKCVAQIRNVCLIDGKNWNPDKSFAFQRVDLNTDVLSIEDTEKYFNFRKLYNAATEGIEIEKKNKDSFFLPFTHSPKMAITTNYDLLDSSIHSVRRVKKLILSRYFNLERTPRSEFDNKNFFYDWDDEDWTEFYAFSFFCIQKFYQNGILQSSETENSTIKAIKLKAGSAGSEFYTYCSDKILEKNEVSYAAKEFWTNFLEDHNVDKKEFLYKHFKDAVFFFCSKKGYECELKRDDARNPYNGKYGIEKFFIKKKPKTEGDEIFEKAGSNSDDLPF